MTYDDELLIDEEVKAVLDESLLALDNVTTGRAFGGVSYEVGGRPFAILLEGVVALNLPPDLRRRGLSLAGVSPFTPPFGDKGFDGWVQMVVLLPEDLKDVLPWLEAAYKHVASST
ncbi:MAG: hypothetical protein L0177_13715 [Chloroflexi bacterium]|nr:hypothetical protein [Chloroflexota bacterium]